MKIRLTLVASTFALAVLGMSSANAASSVSGDLDTGNHAPWGFLNFHLMQQKEPSALPGNANAQIAPLSRILTAHPDRTEFFTSAAGKSDLVDAGTVRQQASFSDAVIVPSAVPEPAIWAMMLIGFGAVGFAMRRRISPALKA